MTRLFTSVAGSLLIVLAGCSSDGSDPDAGADGGADAEIADAGPIDAGPCTAVAAATLGSGGGTLEHCGGARLVVPPGALAGPTTLTIERLASPPEPLAPYVLVGDAFAFGGAPAGGFAELVEVVVPHQGGSRIEMAELVDGEWQTFEACHVTESTISQEFRRLGTFVALRDPTPYPDGVTGAGEGTIDYDFDGFTEQLSVDPDGYAIDEDPSEGRAITVVFRRSEAGALVQVDLRFAIDAEGVVHPVQLERADTSVSEIWGTNVLGFPDDLTVTITRDEGGTIEGSVDATLHLGDQERPFAATFTASPVPYRYPPELACANLPKG